MVVGDGGRRIEEPRGVSHQGGAARGRIKRSKLVAASVAVVIIVLATIVLVRWYDARLDCRLDVTVYVEAFPGAEPPESLEGLELELALCKGDGPHPLGKIMDRITVRTDDNKTAHGIFRVDSTGRWSVWVRMFDESRVGDVLDITESADGETIPVEIVAVYG